MCNLSCTIMISQRSGSGPELAHAAGVNMVLVPAEAECQSGAWWSHDPNLEVSSCVVQCPRGNRYSLI